MKIDIDEFEAAFAEALPENVAAMKKKSTEKHAIMGEAMPVAFLDIGSLSTAKFCTLWPKIEGFLNLAIGAFGWFRPVEAGQAKAFIAALKKTIIPTLCPVEKP